MRLPSAGELNRRVTFHLIQTVPVGDSDVEHQETTNVTTWGKVEVVGGSTYWESVSIEEAVTHRIWVRAVPDRTRPQDLRHLTEVEVEGIRFRVRRTTDVDNLHRFTMMECEELSNG